MKQRLITGIIAAVGFVLLLYIGGISYLAIILLMSLIGYYEFLKLNRFRLNHLSAWIGMLTTFMIVIPWELVNWGIQLSIVQVVWLSMLAFMTVTVLSRNRINLPRIAILFLGAFYIGIGFYAMLAIRLDDQFGLIWSFFVFACIWATDSGAYLAGRMFGNRLLWPAISPKKTIEGAAGGILLSVIAAIIFVLLFPEQFTWSKALMIGFLIACFAQLGDLIQSAYKRAAKIKDTGKILPGHGGILDRCDSWLIVFPMIYILFGG